MNTGSIIYIPHGGGPMPLLGHSSHDGMVAGLQDIANSHKRPSAILVVSAHWEAPHPSINIKSSHELLFDYSGFPQEAYDYRYPAPGEPDLGSSIFEKLSAAGLDPQLERSRGLDHGVFVPLLLMYPDADIPVVELSLVRGLDPAFHIKMGKAIASLDWPNLMVIGSGMSFHNPRAIASPPAGAQELNRQFHDWLDTTLVSPDVPFEQRSAALVAWEEAPAARFCHPREEHLIPLHVCFGMSAGSQTPAKVAFETEIMGTKVTCLEWGRE